MKQELDDKLVKAFPLLYADRHGDKRATCMCWGFTHGDGWFDLIWEASSKLEPLIQKWVDENGTEGHPRASQVKEKFGTLRFYMTGATDEMWDIAAAAEEKSWTTCEACGKPGEQRRGRWIRTLCGECNEDSSK